MAISTYPKALSNAEISSFCIQMAMILNSGISSMEGISIMTEDAQSEEEELILLSIADTLNATGNLCQSLKHSQVFPDYMVNMIDIGEQSGKLDEVFFSLSEHYDREAGIASAIKNAITYPFIMICMMMLVILVLITKVLPIFAQVFKQLGHEMTGISKVILNISSLLNRYSIVLVFLLIAFVIFFIFCSYSAIGHTFFTKISHKLTFTKLLSRKIASCRFASGMALTLSSGLDSDQSLKLVGTLVDDSDFQKRILNCKEQISNGIDFSVALSKSGIFSGIYARMVTVGFKTGSLDDVMKKIASQYEDEIDNNISHIISILEPTLVAILSIIVGIILLSIMLPLVGIMSNL
ncbi:MAG: type II secretion system F family protein [Lachnospiraceae bacterium]